MQRVARESGVTTMALYRYFPGKAELVEIMIESAGGPAPELEASPESWKIGMIEWAHRCAAIYRKHPWFLEATTTRRGMMGPNELSWMEMALALLTQGGLSLTDAYYAFLAIIGHIRGYATFDRLRDRDRTPQQWHRELNRLLLAQSGRHPVLQAALSEGALFQTSEQAFDYGLNCILDGIDPSKRKREAKIAR
jgi:AcrR family transcriptional regulator